MSHLRQTILTLSLAAASLGACAQADSQHAQHHATATAADGTSARHMASRAANVDKMAAMDSRMKMMHEAHNDLLGSKTPEEKSASMAKHMKAMQDGMQTMDMMGPDGMGSMKGERHFGRNSKERQEMMQKRMEMMESMMQMMMDRMPPAQ
jgi:hypothetical protein